MGGQSNVYAYKVTKLFLFTLLAFKEWVVGQKIQKICFVYVVIEHPLTYMNQNSIDCAYNCFFQFHFAKNCYVRFNSTKMNEKLLVGIIKRCDWKISTQLKSIFNFKITYTVDIMKVYSLFIQKISKSPFLDILKIPLLEWV